MRQSAEPLSLAFKVTIYFSDRAHTILNTYSSHHPKALLPNTLSIVLSMFLLMPSLQTRAPLAVFY